MKFITASSKKCRESVRAPSRYDSAGRTHFFICEIALDLADRHTDSTLRNRQLALAINHAKQADRIARDTMDVGLAHLMQLLWARLDCALDCQADYIGPVERVLKASNSPLLAAQAWTVLGRVFGAIGGTASPLNAFGNALYVLRGSDMPSQKVWAQRALFGFEQRLSLWWTCATGTV